MKLTHLLTGILFLLGSAFAHAENRIDASPANEVESAQAILQQHSLNCGSGNRGWWLKLDFSTYSSGESGGINTSSGQYWGCGTCGDCRTKLDQDIDSLLNNQKQNCTAKGGEVKSENRGTITEDIHPDNWRMSSTLIGITCEKWIACN